MEEIGKDDVPLSVRQFHEKAIAFSSFLQAEAEKKYANVKMRPISHGAMFRIHTWAIGLHTAILENCMIGWAQIAGVLLRALMDCLINVGVIGEKNHDVRAFCYFYHYQLSRLADTSIPKDERAKLRAELEPGLALLKQEEKDWVEKKIAEKALGGAYWYSFEFRSPTDVLKKTASSGQVQAYNYLSGAAHGGHVTSNLFLDEPDKHSIEPRRNPKGATLAIVYSTRFLLEICRIRVQHEQPEGRAVIDGLIDEFVKLKDVVGANPA